MKLGELALVFIAVLSLWFFMAKKIDSDEGRKGAASAAVTAVIGAYGLWKRKENRNQDADKE